ncbi:WAP, Kazal, immunoglobulin, Kunitz and NTR domain-containing protein 2-like isoform X1 [Gadus morhua]|uniref:WAP, Kazal, immunoglobulin, Kunitz and NTR domain-containing protein 2-like isoform X1 n=1 Tax=Gadus morhua TaxID=8049 RepID=UPI0011B42750|nr:WAP, Kazal, immunoglobulin, Kunitz and NTR domain-containing protein 2-like isoform X1 [Gadus morhua]
MWWMLFPRWIWFLAYLCAWMDPHATAMPRAAPSHAGICPNEMNPNLWVDAMSTCTRECEHDQACESFERCCSNVCGTRSCVAARHVDANKGPVGAPQGPTCAGSTCPQQGSTCDIWDGQPVCRCLDRCEREPLFTCASDGMTYYNLCYMDAEACSKGISLSVVTCRFHLTWPSTSPSLAPRTTLRPTTATLPATTAPPAPPARPQPPVLLSSPVHQAVGVGDTASFLCDVGGRPRPAITWERRRDPVGGAGAERVPLGPNTVRGNMVVTNIGQLVVYNSQPGDSGVYTCTAESPLGSVAANHTLTVLPSQPPAAAAAAAAAENVSRCLPEACVRPPGAPGNSSGAADCGGDQAEVVWYYEPASNSCLSLTSCPSGGPSEGLSPPQGPRGPRVFQSFEECMRCCGPELSGPCGLPRLQGPCKAYEPRWAYSAALLQCQSFIYGGCHGNDNNFESKEACEEMCPFPRNHHCKACRSRGRMVTSFCRSDFVILGRMTELTEDGDSGHALVAIEEILKDDKMGLHFFGREPLEVTFAGMDWSCPCPNVRGAAAEGQVIVMGHVSEGAAVLRPESYVGASSPRRLRKLREVISKNTCDILKDITNSPQ